MEGVLLPENRRKEVKNERALRDEFNQVKKQKLALKRRMKLIQRGWRNGIVGVEGPADQPMVEELQGKLDQPLFVNHQQNIDDFKLRQQYRSERKYIYLSLL